MLESFVMAESTSAEEFVADLKVAALFGACTPCCFKFTVNV
jgi:hypothetical protein